MKDGGYFDEEVAATYDRDHGRDGRSTDRAVKVLHDLAKGESALEFAIGTGRIALPLSALGCKVSGIELSPAMVAELRKKETGKPLEIVIGDMTEARGEGTFALVFLVYNTIDNLTSQDAQAACFRNAADHLAPGGRFVIETQVPPVQRLVFGETLLAFSCSDGHMGIDDIDVATQCYRSNHTWIEPAAPRSLSIPFRYVWPSELDLMGKLAGLELEHRWGDWDRSPFDRFSKRHVSVWRKPSS